MEGIARIDPYISEDHEFIEELIIETFIENWKLRIENFESLAVHK